MSQKPTTAQNATLTCTERHDTGPEVATVERHVDTGERNGGETTLKLDASLRLLLLLRLLVARVDNLSKHRLDLVDSELLGELCEVSVHDSRTRIIYTPSGCQSSPS